MLGYGDTTGAGRDNEGKPLSHRDVAAGMENELMETEESEWNREEELSHSDDSSSDEEGPVPGNVGLPPAFGRRRRPPWVPHPGLGDDDDDDEIFEGEGHRLGGKEVPPIAGDVLIPELKMHASGNGIQDVWYEWPYSVLCTCRFDSW